MSVYNTLSVHRTDPLSREAQEWERLYGFTTKLDMWAIGAIVWELMVLTGKTVNRRRDIPLGVKDNIYVCRPNQYVTGGGECFGETILDTEYSQKLKSIVQVSVPKTVC